VGSLFGMDADSVAINKANWDERAPAHARSKGYGVERFVLEPDRLSSVVRFDRPRLGDINGLRGVHLQCHIGTDTLSLVRLGARMSALDFSPVALTQARELARRTNTAIDFHEANVYDAVEVFGAGRFDLVYTGVGALCWLPDIRRWARVVADLLRPGGRLFIREGHPMLWAINEVHTDRAAVEFPYFETTEPFVYEDATTYVDSDVTFTHNVTHTWNHGLGETVTALMDAGMTLTMFAEHDSVPWNALPGQMVEDDQEEWRLSDNPNRLAASYTLQAVKAG
jgi:SAM-dependent methyltransferase